MCLQHIVHRFLLQTKSKCCTIKAQKAMTLWNGWYAQPYQGAFLKKRFLQQEEEYQSALPVKLEGIHL